MNFHILTLFPDMVMQGLATSITGRAMKQNKITVQAVDIRDFAHNKHRKVDDYTYGGGAGMLMQADPVYEAWESVRDKVTEAKAKSGMLRTIYVTPQGRRFDQRMAEDFAQEEDLVILCGHYEGVDERVLEEIVTDDVSIGDYVLTGGELAAMVIVDAVSRLVPGVLHNQESAQTETFAGDLLEYPQYTQPRIWNGKAVPEVLLSGNERKIRQWRLEQSVARTKDQRPDLYQKYERLQQCREFLMQQKILHIDMIELINRRRAELLYWEDKKVLLRDIRTGICYHTRLDLEKNNITGCMGSEEVQSEKLQTGETQKAGCTPQEDCNKVELLIEDSEKMSGNGTDRIPCLILHQQFCVQEMEFQPMESQKTESGYSFHSGCGFSKAEAYIQAVCTRREMLPVSGLYRADGSPMETGPNRGLQIHSMSDLLSFCVPDSDGSLMETRPNRETRMDCDLTGGCQQIAPAVMYGAYFGEEPAGWIALLADGSIGMLYVLPEYRRRHIAMALETYAINQLLPQGEIPYGRIPYDCHAAIALQQRLGLSLSKTPVYCLDVENCKINEDFIYIV